MKLKIELIKMKNKALILLPLLISFACSNKPENKVYDYELTAVPIKNVVLTDNFWLPKIKTIQLTTIQYAFDKCYQEGRMDNFLIAGGKMEGETRGKMPFDDTDLYKIIEGASYSLISNPDPKLDAYLDSIISIINTGQEKDGYLTTWFTIDPASPPASWVKPSKFRWENEISSHELYNSGHLYEAAAAHYLATGKRNFLDIALRNADLLTENFGPGKNYTVPGHQIVETGLIKLYRITGEEKYLNLSKFFLDERGDSLNHNLYGAYNQDHMPVIRQEEVTGHAVRAVYMYAAMTDIAALKKDTAYRKAVDHLWQNMVNRKMYITGGIGARHDGEAFGADYELPNRTAYGETCAAIGSVYWNHRLFLMTGDVKYVDIIERTLYNGLIAGISTDGMKFFYPNPLESDAKFTFNHGSCTRQGWFDCSCCPTNLIRFIPAIPELIYATKGNNLYINLYMANHAEIDLNNLKLTIQQETGYPNDGNIKIVLHPDRTVNFDILLRVPHWMRNMAVPGDLYSYMPDKQPEIQLRINGKAESVAIENGYIRLSRQWSEGDSINLEFPMQVKRIIANPKVIDDIKRVSFEYGPLVYCAEEIDNGSQLNDFRVSGTDKIQVDYQNNLLGGTNTITLNQKGTGKELVLIPYYLWSNRNTGKMLVWFQQ
jgi:DUF1680 family protein